MKSCLNLECQLSESRVSKFEFSIILGKVKFRVCAHVEVILSESLVEKFKYL